MGKKRKGPAKGIDIPDGIIISSWKGIAYLKSKPASVANPRTPDQVNQRKKMLLSLDFLRANILMVRSGFRFYKAKRSAFNAALSYMLTHGFNGSGEQLEIDYSQVLLSRGDLTKPLEGKFQVTGEEMMITWNREALEGNAKASDRAMIAVYNPANKASLIVLKGPRRSEGDIGQKLTLPVEFRETPLLVFLVFNSADERLVSDSVLCRKSPH